MVRVFLRLAVQQAVDQRAYRIKALFLRILTQQEGDPSFLQVFLVAGRQVEAGQADFPDVPFFQDVRDDIAPRIHDGDAPDGRMVLQEGDDAFCAFCRIEGGKFRLVDAPGLARFFQVRPEALFPFEGVEGMLAAGPACPENGEIGIVREDGIEHVGHQPAAGVLVDRKGRPGGRPFDGGVNEYVGNAFGIQLAAEISRLVLEGRADHDGIGRLFHDGLEGGPAGIDIILVVREPDAVDIDVRILFQGGFDTAPYRAPVFSGAEGRNGDDDGEFLAEGDGGGVDVDLVIHFPQDLLHFFPASRRDFSTIVEDAVHRAGGYAGHLRDVFDLDLFGHG